MKRALHTAILIVTLACALVGAIHLTAGLASILRTGMLHNPSPYVWFWKLVVPDVMAAYIPTPIKSIQHGTLTWGSLATTTLTITSVRTTATVIQMAGNGWSSSGDSTDLGSTRATLTNNTTVTLDKQGTTAGIVVEFDVIEYLPVFLKHATGRNISATVLTGGVGSGSVATGFTVNLAKTFPTFQGCQMNDSQSGTRSVFHVVLDSTTTGIVRRSNGSGAITGSGFDCMFGLVEFK